MGLNKRPRELRQNSPFPERLLRSRLRARRLFGLKFRRQHRIGRFVVDFFNHDHNLVIEIDGDSHHGRAEEDRQRQDTIESEGYRVLRISNDDVIENIDTVLLGIALACGIELKG